LSFPHKRESIGLEMGPRLRGGDGANLHCLGSAKEPWELRRRSLRVVWASRYRAVGTLDAGWQLA